MKSFVPFCVLTLLPTYAPIIQAAEPASLDRPSLKIERESHDVLKVSFPSVAAQRYQLAFSGDFQRWEALGDLFKGTGQVIALRVPKPNGTGGFLRVETSAEPEAAGDEKRIIGVWRGGWPNETAPTYELVITPEKITGQYLNNGSSLGEGTYKLDTTKKTIDATMTVNPGKGTVYLGLYALEGDMLKWCSSNGTRKRPVELAYKPAADHYLLILRRQN